MGLPDTSPVPKKDSMGMDYIAVYEGDEPSDGKTIKVSLDRVQRSGVRTEPVAGARSRSPGARGRHRRDRRAPRHHRDDALGRLCRGPVRQHHRPARARRRAAVPRLQPGYPAGASAICWWPRAGSSAAGGSGLRANPLDGAMQRLRNLGVPESRIREIRDSGANPRTIDWPAPADGTVIVKRIINGQRVVAGDELYRIVDLTQCLGDRRRRRRRSRRHQARRTRHRDVPRLSRPAGRRRRDLHLSGGEDGNAHRRACASKSPIRTSG